MTRERKTITREEATAMARQAPDVAVFQACHGEFYESGMGLLLMALNTELKTEREYRYALDREREALSFELRTLKRELVRLGEK